MRCLATNTLCRSYVTVLPRCLHGEAMWMYCHLWRPCHSQGRAGKQAGVHGGHMTTSRTSRNLRNAATRGRLSAEGVALYFLPRCLHGEAMWIHCHLWRPCQSQGCAGKKAGVHIVTIARQKLCSWLTKPALCGLSRIALVTIGRSARTLSLIHI